ncbi:MAG: DUF4358 domain-containing protein [Candidatus Limivivens sp.]|nr:DUF4358 domain-containing protein [Candidatus Limivivens sp.]
MKHLKPIRCLIAVMLCVLALTGCGKKETKEVTAAPADLAKQLAEETVTSDVLTEVSADILASTYFVDMEQVEASSAYMSTGASACETAVIKCKDSSYTSEVEKLLKNRVSNQTTLYSSYNAGETKKLDAAIIKTSGQYVVLCVCDDTSKADSILTEAGF